MEFKQQYFRIGGQQYFRIEEVGKPIRTGIQYEYGLLIDVGYLQKLIQQYSANIVDANVIEKLEQEQIDDKYILRWTANIDASRSTSFTEENMFSRVQSGLIYVPNALHNTGLLTLFTTHGEIGYKRQDRLSGIWTSAYIWYNEIPYSKQPHIVVFTASPVTQALFGIQSVYVPRMLWTNEYELPPLSVSTINNGISILKSHVEQLSQQLGRTL